MACWSGVLDVVDLLAQDKGEEVKVVLLVQDEGTETTDKSRVSAMMQQPLEGGAAGFPS